MFILRLGGTAEYAVVGRRGVSGIDDVGVSDRDPDGGPVGHVMAGNVANVCRRNGTTLGSSASSTFTSLTSFVSSSPLQRLSEAPQFEPAKAALGPDAEARPAETNTLVAAQPLMPGALDQPPLVPSMRHLGLAENPAETGVVPASYQTSIGGAVPDQTACGSRFGRSNNHAIRSR